MKKTLFVLMAVLFVAAFGVKITNNVQFATRGVDIKMIQQGNGDRPPFGSTVTVHYTGTLANGEKFDSSRGGAPLSFELGVGKVIKGWDEGIAQMSVGERSILTIQPDYGYGARGAPPVIPPNSVLTFDVELLSYSV